MLTLTSSMKASYKPDPNKPDKVYFGNSEGQDSKKNTIKVIARKFLVPATVEEFNTYIGGDKNWEKAMKLIAEDYSGAEAKKHLIGAKLEDASVRDEVLGKILRSSETFTLATLLEEEASQKEKAAATDEIASLDPSDPNYITKVQEILARVR